MKFGGPRFEDPTPKGCRPEDDLYKSCACLEEIFGLFCPEFKRKTSTANP
jgi:hypothetical protein